VASAYSLNSLADIATMVNGAIVNGHQRNLENQSDRIGLQYMSAAGYDPREAPAVWKLMGKKTGVSATNFFWSAHDNEPTRRSYLMNELKNTTVTSSSPRFGPAPSGMLRSKRLSRVRQQ
jgi:predicted Zn-dependent protease